MGAFDDLIPGQGNGAGGAFDDLIPEKPRGQSAADVVKDVGLSLWNALPSSRDRYRLDERDRQAQYDRANAAAADMREAQGRSVSGPELDRLSAPGTATVTLNRETGRYETPGRAQDLIADTARAFADIPSGVMTSLEKIRVGADGRAGSVIESERMRDERANQERRASEIVKTYPLNMGGIEEGMRSLPFSLVSMGAHLAGKGAGSLIPVRGAGDALGMAASAAAGYTMDRADVWNRLYPLANAEFRKGRERAGMETRDMTPDEFTELARRPEIADEVNKHAMAEAGFEALGNLITSKAFGSALKGTLIKATASDAAQEIAKRGALAFAKAGLKSVAGEMATEMPTEIAQGQAETALGMRKGPAPEWTRAEDWGQAFKDVFWPVVTMSGTMAGTAKAASVPLDAYGNARMAGRIDDMIRAGGLGVIDDKQLDALYGNAKSLGEARHKDAKLAQNINTIQDEKIRRGLGAQQEGGGNDLQGNATLDSAQGAAAGRAGVADGTGMGALAEAERALLAPKSLTALDRVAEIDAALPSADPEAAAAMQAERDGITASWPAAVPGLATTFSTETGVRLAGRYALMDADDLVTSHDTNLRPVAAYPAELQPRERERHASEMQVQQITQKLEPARLGESADVATGAPIVGADGLVESGNARTIALKRVYQANGQKAEDYRQFLRDNATRFGVTAEEVSGLKKPVLVRLRETPVNRAEFARQANQATVARMSPSEQAKADAAMMDSLDDLQPDEQGDFMSGNSRPFIRRFMAKLPATEQAGLIDAQGNLSQTGYARIRNAVLARAYGDSPVLLRMVESLDDNTRNLSKALMLVAPQVAKTREAIDAGALFDADITPDLVTAVEEMSRLREAGQSVKEALSQRGMFGDKLAPEARELLAFMDENMRRPRQIAAFIQRYMEALEAAGNPNQGSLLGEATAPAKGDLMAAAKRGEDATATTEDAGRGQPGEGRVAGAEGQRQPEDAAGDQRGAQGDARAGFEFHDGQILAFGRVDAFLERHVTDKPAGASVPNPIFIVGKLPDQGVQMVAQFIDGFGDKHATVRISGRSLKHADEQRHEAFAQVVERLPGIIANPVEALHNPTRADSAFLVYEGDENYLIVLEVAKNGNGTDIVNIVTTRDRGLRRYRERSAQWLEGRQTPHPRASSEAPAGGEFSDVQPRAEASISEEAARRQAAEDFRDALNDLGAITRDFAGVARIVPEDHPGLMDTLVRLFDAAIRLGYHDAKKAVTYVKEQLRADARFKAVWNKILPETYRKAAAQAAEQRQGGNDDLFGRSPSANEAGNILADEKVAVDIRSSQTATARAVAAPDIPASWRLADNGQEYIDEHGFIRAKDLNQRERAAEQAFYDEILRDEQGLIRQYREIELGKDEGLIVDPDRVKNLSPDYRSDPQIAKAVHEPSSHLSKQIFAQWVKQHIETPVIFTAGGGGSGKSEAMQHALKAAGIDGHNGVVFDSTLSAFGSARKKIDQVLGAGGKAIIAYTNSPLDKAFDFSMWRKRVVPIKVLAAAHQGASDTVHQLAEHYKGNENVRLIVINNDGGLEDIRLGTVEDVPHYDYNENVERLYAKTQEARNEGRISEDKFTALVAGLPGEILQGRQRRLRGVPQEPSESNDDRLPGGGSRQGGSGGGIQVVGSREARGTDNQTSGVNGNADRKLGSPGPAGQGAAPVQGSGGKRRAQRLRQGQGGGDLFADDQPGAPDGQPVRLQQDGRPDGATEDHERRPAAGARGRAGRATGVPAGRDIPAKSGRNYRFTDDDLTYDGGWQKKAAQNVEAVELVKRLEAEGRQATREEQTILAKFIGWGASEIRNSIFGNKYARETNEVKQYEDAVKALAEAGGESLKRGDDGYTPAHYLVNGKLYSSGHRYGDPITRAMLDKARPDATIRKWIDLRARLKAVMTEEEWATAERSTQYAHYTSRAVVESMWKAVERMGFKGGAVLEPGAGIGVFPGLMSPAMATNSVYTGIEFDNITGAVLKHLFPDERILVESFVDSALPDGFYDLAIGNPPFANIPILSDPKYKKLAFSLHDYFFAKSIDKVKPGGLMIYVTSRYTMDKQGDKARKYLSERADLVGAIRLPQTAFMKNAGTEVVTDVLFLRKKSDGEKFDHGKPWIGVQEVKTDKGPALINEYFAAHPEMVLGTHSLEGSMYSKNEYTVLPVKGADIEAQFAAAVENLPADIYRATGAAAEAAQVREIDFNPKAQKEGNYYVTDAGVLMQREGGVGVRADAGKPEKTVALLKDFVKLRDALKQAHYDQLNDGPWEASLKALQKAYAAFVKKNGRVLQNKAFERKTTREDEETGQAVEDIVIWRRFDLLNKLNDDPDYTLVEALERLNEETGEITESPFLHERVLARPAQPRIDTPHDALLSVLNDTGKVDLPLIAQRLGLNDTETAAALGTAIYESPAGGWLMADEYLSGNVKQKLKEAQEAAKTDRRFERNVEALLTAQPAPVPPSDITASIGMNWIPPNLYAQFLKEKTGVLATVDYNERTGNWSVTAIAGYQTPAATADWGTLDRNAADILDNALTGRPIRITRTEGSGENRKTVFDAAATEAANQKLAQMRAAFAEWIWQDGERADSLTRLYNDKFNTIVPRKFDGRHLTLPGSTTTIKVFDHVKRGAWRVIQSGNTYLAHSVGSGKTWQMVISAMEQKRLGLIQKPMMVVPNHMLQQFAREWLQLYPAARLMVADEKQFHTDNRRRFVSRVAMSDVDGVIITHSAFKLLDLDPEFKRVMIQEQLDYLRAALEEAGGEEGKKSREPKVRDIQNRIEKMEQKLEAVMSGAGKDKNVRFDQLGVDMLYVDEAHEFRKLAFTTQRQVKGIDSSGSDRAFDLWMKTRWLEQKRPGRSLVMASGTPVTNTLAELYSVQRFMAPQVLEDRSLQDFDSWSAMFGQENTEIEADASGKYSPVTRFTKFVNVPELTQMFREYADVLTSDHLAEMLGDKRPKVKGGSRNLLVTPQTADYAFYKEALATRLQASRNWKPSPDEPNNPDPIIKIIGDGRLAAIDMRFVNPSLPSDPDSKLNQMIDCVIEVYKRTAGNEYLGKDGQTEPAKGGAQMVFSDLGFGAGVTEHRGFNARAWMEKRLRDAGIPPGQVAFMSDHKKSTAKLKLFQDVNAGRVRVLVGSSKNMGTGVNAQQRLVALHHLDTPWYPADLEQREGRIIRQGNKNPLVEIYAFSTKGSYDTVMWQMLASKQRFIDQALSGDSSVRSIDDLTEASQFQIATAMTAGDPRAIQLAGIKADIEKYQRLFRAHEETRMRLRQEYDRAGTTAEYAARQLPQAEKMAGQVQDLSGDNFKAKANGKAFDKRKDWGEALLATLKDNATRGKEGRVKVGELSGFPVEFFGQIVRDLGGKVKEYRSGLAMAMGEESLILAHDHNDDAVGMSMRVTNAVAALARKPAELRQRIEEAKAKRAALEDRLEAKFQFAGELADKLKEADALEAAMVADSKAAQEQTDAPEALEGGTMLSRGAGRGMAPRDLKAVVARISKHLKNLPAVHVLEAPSQAPKELRDYIRKHGAWNDVEGAFHEGEIYLFASGIADEARAEFVLATHEITHYGLRGVMGKDLDAALNHLLMFNGDLKRQAIALKERNKLDSNVEAMEEILADMPTEALVKITGWRAVVRKVRDWLVRIGARRLADRLNAWMAAGMDEKRQADWFVADLVSRAREWVKNGKVGPQTALYMGGTRLSDTVPAKIDRRLANWADRVLRKAAGTEPVMLVFSKPPDVLRIAGMFRPVVVDVEHAGHAMNIHPEISPQDFGALPDLLARPRAVFRHKSGWRVMVDARDSKGDPLVVALTQETLKDGSKRLKVTEVSTVFGKEDSAAYVARELDKGNVLWMPEKEIAHLTDLLSAPQLSIQEGKAPTTDKPLGHNNGRKIKILSDEALVNFRQNPNGDWKARTVEIVLPVDAAELLRGTRFSRASAATPVEREQTVAERADAILKSKAGTPKPLDTLIRAPLQAVRFDKLTGLIYDKAAFFLDRLTPEQIKAGVVSDYGIPEAVIDQRAGMQGRMREQLRKTGTLLEKLSTLTRAESRVAYEWMNADDPQSADHFRAQLPPESIRTMAEVEKMIDQLSQEAVRLGQLDPEAFKRNRYAYLRRSYVKHTQELTKGETKSRARAISILGDQYKGRGMDDAVEMGKVKNAAPEWWNRKLRAGRADKQLKGEKLIRLERRAHSGEGTQAMPGIGDRSRGRLMEVAYWPAGEPIPAKFSTWDQSGTWEVRDTRGDKLIVWRDFTKQEREAMGEIDEARYAIAKTLHGMIHDVEVGRYLEWLGQRYGKKPGEAIDGTVVEASERMRDTFAPGEWVRVPDSKIPGTNTLKYGALAGRYLPGPIWNDVRQIIGGRFKPLGDTYAAILSAWKTSKTALSPAVHMNNIMANFVMADWHDVTAGHIAKALRLLLAAHERDGKGMLGRAGNLVARAGAAADLDAAREILDRFQDSGGSIGTWATQELQKEQLEPLLKALEAEIATAGEESAQVGAMAALQHLLRLRFPSAWDAVKPTKAGQALTTEARNMIALYEAEDQVFRLAAWLKAKEDGANDIAAGKAARKSFLDYHINAPWVQAMRNTAFPFIAFTYRALPMLAETAAKKPWKLMKLALLAGGLNALGYALSGGDEDDERRWLPEEKAGRVFGLVPKLIRMPWNDIHGQPVFLDIRRFVPVGDIFDTGQAHSAVPVLPAMIPGGPLALLGEIALNKAQFTGKDIALETDTPAERAGKVIGYVYKAFAPNLVFLPGTYSFDAAVNAGKGKTDTFGREQSLTQAIVSSVGVKLGSYPQDVLRLNSQREAQAKLMEIDRNITALKRERQRNGITDQEFRSKVEDQLTKKRKVAEKLQEKATAR